MSPEEKDPAYLLDMLLAARDVASFVEGRTYDDYLSDRKLRLAVERALKIVGEASRRVSPQFKDAHPEMSWRDYVGLRNVLSHDYDNVQHDLIWAIATTRVPELIARLEALVPPEEP